MALLLRCSRGRNDGEVRLEWVRSSLDRLYSLHDEEAEVRAPIFDGAGDDPSRS
jgi:hypothetical protein